jgi:hypothetical protein
MRIDPRPTHEASTSLGEHIPQGVRLGPLPGACGATPEAPSWCRPPLLLSRLLAALSKMKPPLSGTRLVFSRSERLPEPRFTLGAKKGWFGPFDQQRALGATDRRAHLPGIGGEHRSDARSDEDAGRRAREPRHEGERHSGPSWRHRRSTSRALGGTMARPRSAPYRPPRLLGRHGRRTATLKSAHAAASGSSRGNGWPRVMWWCRAELSPAIGTGACSLGRTWPPGSLQVGRRSQQSQTLPAKQPGGDVLSAAQD